MSDMFQCRRQPGERRHQAHTQQIPASGCRRRAMDRRARKGRFLTDNRPWWLNVDTLEAIPLSSDSALHEY